MLKMAQVQDIRQLVLQEGRSIRWTARQLGGSEQKAGIEAGRRPAGLDQVAQDLANLGRIGDDRDELHLGSTPRAHVAYAPGRNELRESGDEVRRIPEGGVLLEVGEVSNHKRFSAN